MFLKSLVFAAAVSAAAPLLHAQALPSASRLGDLKIGAGYSNISPDTSANHFNGVAAWADFDLTRHLGLEGEFHFGSSSVGTGEFEASYEIGGRYFRTYGRLVPYAKVLYGRGVYHFTEGIQLQGPNGPFTYFFLADNGYNLAAAGAGADYKLTRRIYLRGDWEYQRWFQFQDSSLSPIILTAGAAWHF